MCVYPSLAQGHISNMKSSGYVNAETAEDGLKYSSKMDSVIETILSRKNNENRKIIFTNFRGEIDYLKRTLTSAGLIVASIDGRTTSKRKRHDILKKELDVLILQIKTGNEGLNLQQYNEVYFVTPEWNPKMEEQAIARCHRIGQKKQVHVFRFIMNSFDKEQKTSNIEMYTETIQDSKNEISRDIMYSS
jgi:SNF2 family DNA or RNA helicase